MTNEAPVPPVYDHVVERLAQRLAGDDENADMPEYRKRAAKLLAEVQKPAPSPLAAQIEKVQREIGYAQFTHAPMSERLWSAVLASLQQHERALAVVKQAAEGWDRLNAMYAEQDALRTSGKGVHSGPRDGFEGWIDDLVCNAKDALDDAAAWMAEIE